MSLVLARTSEFVVALLGRFAAAGTFLLDVSCQESLTQRSRRTFWAPAPCWIALYAATYIFPVPSDWSAGTYRKKKTTVQWGPTTSSGHRGCVASRHAQQSGVMTLVFSPKKLSDPQLRALFEHLTVLDHLCFLQILVTTTRSPPGVSSVIPRRLRSIALSKCMDRLVV